MAIVKNQANGVVTLHATANTTWIIAGNNSVSNVTATDSEVVIGGSIRQVWCGSSSGNGQYWVVKRGANTVGVFDSTAWIDFSGNGTGLSLDEAGTLVVELHNPAGGAGYIMIDVKKVLGT